MTSSSSLPIQREVWIPAEPVRLQGSLALPSHSTGLVLFAHGNRSGRLSPRNAAVSGQLRAAGLGTLLFDLLTGAESGDRRNFFDIELLSERLLTATEWVSRQSETAGLPLGYFGASTGAAAALRAAAVSPINIAAVVSRGGRPDLAGDALRRVRAPTLLLVGGRDPVVLGLNETALAQLTCFARLAVIPGASHVFEEPGTLEQAGKLAAAWLVLHLVPHPGGSHQ